MKALISLSINAFRLHLRARPAMFTTVVMPFLAYFIYMAIFAGGNPSKVLAFLAPVLVLMATTNGIYGVGGDLLLMREGGSLTAYRLAPVSSTQILLSRIWLDFVMTLLVGLVELLISVELYRVPLHVHVIDLIAIAIMSAATLGSLGAIVVSISNSFFEANMYSQVIFLTIFILSGVTLPVTHLPHAAQYLSRLLPTTMLVDALTGILVSGARLRDYWRELIVLSGFILTAIALASILFRWDKDQRATKRDRLLACISLVPMVLIGLLVHLFGH